MKFVRQRVLGRSLSGNAPVALEGRRVFAIGDIHGCDDLLLALLGALAAAAEGDPVPPVLVFLGDYIDRGPRSKEVVSLLVELAGQDDSVRFLGGNHEEAMLGFLADVESGLAWINFGGRATMRSYGVEAPDGEVSLEDWRRVQEAFKAAIPADHLRFFWQLESRLEFGDYLFVHAGVNPDRPLSDQKQRDLRWIREPFLSDRRRLDKVIVHGHTPAAEPFADRRRIGVDTWAYRSGVLTAAELSGGDVRFWQARHVEGEIMTGLFKGG
ncbi:metallophosphoesterase family protein [Caulobacter sp. NIBR1757]|uniref:metallophosphoesterase family protein n=1 Tax=Caulobacter sp. NIBR1757 TaxID=3016000 RepID=UPI0022F02387|nr:metallophosphoesterase family protein [Caulobacter sp. NIBR1757]WGM40053.1 Bis(5'-nucleosyl)-tetraphosphatase PrpE [asymmetrical] [Caulobacter sp. NIBR1757]